MKRWLEALTIFDWTVLPRAILGNFVNADWQAASQSTGVPGIAGEAAGSILGTNSFTFHTPTDSPWCAADIQAILRKKGISMWGTAYFGGEMSFRVKRQQAEWAQYVLLQNGVPLLHAPRTAGVHVSQDRLGYSRPPGELQSPGDAPAKNPSWLEELASALFDD